jgi:hypothetical protein
MLTVILVIAGWTVLSFLGWFAWLCILPPYDAEAELAAQLKRDHEAERMAGDPLDNVVDFPKAARR